MGQYYKPASLGKSKRRVVAFLESWSYSNGAKLMEHSYLGNHFVGAAESLLMPNQPWHKTPIVWAGDYADNESDRKTNVYQRCKEGFEVKPPAGVVPKEFKYVVNHTKKQFVDKSKIKQTKDVWGIHPLPLLTADGNGRGGGDYHGKNEDMVGIWARNIISVEKEVPAGYKELVVEFSER